MKAIITSNGTTPGQHVAGVFQAQDILKKFNLTFAELKEYTKLKKKFFGTGMFKSLFVVLDETDPKVIRYNDLAKKIMPLNAYLVSNRSNDSAISIADYISINQRR